MGNYHQALEVLRQTMVILAGEPIDATFGQITPPSVAVRVVAVLCHAELGTFAEGMAIGTEGIRIAESIERPFSLAPAYASVGRLCFRQGDANKAIPILERALALCETTQDSFHFPWVASRLAEAYACAGRVAEVLALVKQAMKHVAAGSHILHLAQVFTGLSEASLLADRLEDASDFTERAFALSQDRQEYGVQAHILCLLGNIAMHRKPPDLDQAAAHHQQALTLATERGMRPLQAHCHRGLGTLYRQTGQAEQAHAELSTAITMYRDMEMTFWLPETEAALAEAEGKV
jgi:tetratricopeptide (TPR) repeat protein